MREPFRPATPTQEWLVRYTELTSGIADDEIQNILNGRSHGAGIKGWWKGRQIRIAHANHQHYVELARSLA